jgi:hypothetical protein
MLTTENAEHDLKNYTRVGARRGATNIFELALRTLVPWSNALRKDVQRFPGARITMVALLENRAQYGAIHGWRFGRRKPPRWAKELLAQHLRREAQDRWELATRLLDEDK